MVLAKMLKSGFKMCESVETGLLLGPASSGHVTNCIFAIFCVGFLFQSWKKSCSSCFISKINSADHRSKQKRLCYSSLSVENESQMPNEQAKKTMLSHVALSLW